MSSVNRAILIGNLGHDPEIRQTKSGDSVAGFSLATSERWTDKQTSEKRERTEWHRVVVFGKTAEIAQQYLTKGSKVYIEGAIKTRKWTDDKGVERYTTEIVLSPFRGLLVLPDKKSAGGPPPVNTIDDYGTIRTGQDDTVNSGSEFDDEVPF